jgi:hypothetical protein
MREERETKNERKKKEKGMIDFSIESVDQGQDRLVVHINTIRKASIELSHRHN